jgi:hypothetical protein
MSVDYEAALNLLELADSESGVLFTLKGFEHHLPYRLKVYHYIKQGFIYNRTKSIESLKGVCDVVAKIEYRLYTEASSIAEYANPRTLISRIENLRQRLLMETNKHK